MQIVTARLVLRDFVAEDAPAFLAYQSDPRYVALHGPDEANPSHARGLLQTFERWRSELPRQNYQLGAFSRDQAGTLVGCCGLRAFGCSAGEAELGVELAPDYWGRYGYAVEIVRALLDLGFGTLGLDEVRGLTASGNSRVTRLAGWFGARVTAARPGPAWMADRGWQEVEWRVTRPEWERSPAFAVRGSRDRGISGKVVAPIRP